MRGGVFISARRLVGITTAAWLAGCATIPEEAKDHAGALGLYASKVAEGTVASYDAVCSSYESVGTGLIDNLEDAYGQTGKAMKEASERSAKAAEAAAAIAGPAEVRAAAGDAAWKEAATALRSLEKELRSLSEESGRFAAGVEEACAVPPAYRENLRKHLSGARELRELIQHGMLTLQEGIELHRSLFESYDSVRVSRNAFLGERIAKSFDGLGEKAHEFLGGAAAIAGKVQDAAGAAAAVGK